PPSAPMLDTLFNNTLFTTSSGVTIFGINSTDTVRVVGYVSPSETSPNLSLLKGEGAIMATTWQFPAVLNVGYNYFYFAAVDENNNTSSLSLPAAFVLDTEPPPVPMV